MKPSPALHPHRPPEAFTLMEMLIVVAIIAALAAVSLPVYNRVTQRSRSTACLSNLRQLGAALNLYLGEHNMTMPTMAAGRKDRAEEIPVLDNTLAPYAGDPRLFACPADVGGLAARTGTSYYWNPALNGQSAAALTFLKVENAGRIPVISDKEGFHPYDKDHVNFLYADGHATTDLKLFTDK
jgi:prepilin-type N-terminal cleavage/methylation domain-containing protein/prepilin-type processing-associated H-X9-DG protein